jgi:hypothetical protein
MTTYFVFLLKDRLGELEGGSEWEPIKILLEGVELQQNEHGFQNMSPTQLPKLVKTT